jgi:hypothetical protein
MGAARGVVYVESEGGEWAAITRPEELEALFVSLDKRGVREADLQESIDKNYQIICKAMKVLPCLRCTARPIEVLL